MSGRTFVELDAVLVGRNRKSRKLARNTYAERREDGGIAIRLHKTDVVTHYADGRAVYRTGGWRTVTTKDRMNEFGHPKVAVWSDRGRWFIGSIRVSDGRQGSAVFAEGVTVTLKRGRVRFEGAGTPEDHAEESQLSREIREYARRCVEAFPLDMPGGGDCFICQTKSEDTDHLLSHMAEGYVVPTLVWQAIEAAGCDPQGNGCYWFAHAFDKGRERRVSERRGQDPVERMIVKYLKHKFGIS